MGRFPKANHGVLLSLPPSRQHMPDQSRKRTEYSTTRARKQRSARQQAHIVQLVHPSRCGLDMGWTAFPYLGGNSWTEPNAECKQKLRLNDKPR